jgi:iron complex transport system substrate-binding protein
MRICSLLPGATEIAFALGLGDKVVGVTHECDYPPEAKGKRIVVRSAIDSHTLNSTAIDKRVTELLRTGKSLYTINRDALRDAAPDLILTQDLCGVCAIDSEEVRAAIHSLPQKPHVVSLAPTTLSDVLRDILTVGEITGHVKKAALLVKQLNDRISRIRNQTVSCTSRPRVACLEWFDPLYAAGHWIPQMVEWAGGYDGLGRKGEPSTKVTWQKVMDYAPEVLVLMPCGFDVERTIKESLPLKELPGWNRLPAVISGRVFAANGGAYFSRPGPRLVDGLELLAQIIQPENFPWQAAADAAARLG